MNLVILLREKKVKQDMVGQRSKEQKERHVGERRKDNSTALHNWKETASEFTFSNFTNHTETHGSETYNVKSDLSDEERATLSQITLKPMGVKRTM